MRLREEFCSEMDMHVRMLMGKTNIYAEVKGPEKEEIMDVLGHFLDIIGGTCWSLPILTSIFSVRMKAGHFQGGRGRMGLWQKFEEREDVEKPSCKRERKMVRETQWCYQKY